MEISLSVTTLATTPLHREKESSSSLLSLSSSPGRNSVPSPSPQHPRTSRDIGALVSRRNEAEARLRSRFLRFGSAVRKLVGGDHDHRRRVVSKEDRTDPHTTVDEVPGRKENGGSTASPADERNDTSTPTTSSRLDDLRKRRSQLASLSCVPKAVMAEARLKDATGADLIAEGRTFGASENPPRAPIVAHAAAGSIPIDDDGRKQRIELLRNRRRALEARTNQLLRGESSTVAKVMEATNGTSSTPATEPRMSSTKVEDVEESGHPKRPRREATDVVPVLTPP